LGLSSSVALNLIKKIDESKSDNILDSYNDFTTLYDIIRKYSMDKTQQYYASTHDL